MRLPPSNIQEEVLFMNLIHLRWVLSHIKLLFLSTNILVFIWRCWIFLHQYEFTSALCHLLLETSVQAWSLIFFVVFCWRQLLLVLKHRVCWEQRDSTTQSTHTPENQNLELKMSASCELHGWIVFLKKFKFTSLHWKCEFGSFLHENSFWDSHEPSVAGASSEHLKAFWNNPGFFKSALPRDH